MCGIAIISLLGGSLLIGAGISHLMWRKVLGRTILIKGLIYTPTGLALAYIGLSMILTGYMQWLLVIAVYADMIVICMLRSRKKAKGSKN